MSEFKDKTNCKTRGREVRQVLRKYIVLFVSVVFLVLILALPAFAGQEKVSVCHNVENNPHEISVALPALQAHLAHGDVPVPCPLPEPGV